ncbi:MAG: large conductance mechanosensitive channel protein MscL [Acidimicrobiia bacterium]|nr:large conductance mechanosensitive channel protein MscL [Acidimicrobiia bacterium]
MSIAKEFREFVERGNVVDLAVAVVIGAAFSGVVDSFVEDIFGGVLGALGGEPDLSALTLTIGDGVIRYGAFISAIISFLIVAAAIFLVVKGLNAAKAVQKRKAEEDPEEEPIETEVELLKEIRDSLRQR